MSASIGAGCNNFFVNRKDAFYPKVFNTAAPFPHSARDARIPRTSRAFRSPPWPRRVTGGPAHEPWPLASIIESIFGECETYFTVLTPICLY